MFSVYPKANRGFMRAVNSTKLNYPVRAIFGNRIDRLKEAIGLGWSLQWLGQDAGVLAGKCGPGRNVLLFQPPLAIGAGEVDEVVDRLEHALAATEGAV